MKKRWRFDDGANGFRYDDDAFRFGSEPAYAKGRHQDGALTLRLGGRDDDTVRDMAGGWSREFRLDEREAVTLSFKVKLTQGADLGRKDFADVRVAIDGKAAEIDGADFALRLYGDGAGGGKRGIGWQTIEIDLGRLAAGKHEITLGGFANRKSDKDGFTEIAFDDVRLASKAPREPKLGEFEAEVLKLTNAFRKENGRDPVKTDANLNAAAEDWSREMADGDFFRHSVKPKQITEHGYDPDGWGENIAAGYRTPKEVVNGWIDSPGHRANLLRKDFEHLGIGYHYERDDGGDAPYGHYWTQIFGVPSDDYLV